jgi:hypothetical protein
MDGVPRNGRRRGDGSHFFSVWQARDHRSADVVDELNSFAWCELNTLDVDEAKPFQ